MQWKKGRGKLGVFEPLLGSWLSETASPQGPVTVTRVFSKTLGGKYIKLEASWRFNESQYDELALFGLDKEKRLCVFSFTSDGKRSMGQLVDATDVHSSALAFESQMPAGIARQVYWPDAHEGYHWIVESRTQKGWNRFVEHHYKSKGSE